MTHHTVYIVLAAALVATLIYKGSQKHSATQPPQYLYKVITPEAWTASKNQAEIELSSIDKDFIHFSTDEQLPKTIEKFFGQQPVVVLKIETSRLPGKLIKEKNPGGVTEYYHLYNGSIPRETVIEAHELQAS